MHSIKSVALLILLIFILPTMAIARDVTLAWDPSTDASGYRLYARERGESYAYNDPEWQGTSSQCTVYGIRRVRILLFCRKGIRQRRK